MTGDEKQRIRQEFDRMVNMSAQGLDEWLATEESRSVGMVRAGEGEAVGHQSGRRIVSILGRGRDALTDDDYEHMRAVVGYCHRHLAQRPAGDVRHTRWRYSLMNWGHDPLRD